MDELFRQLKEKYRTHKNVAQLLGIPERTYADWRSRGFKRQWCRKVVEDQLRNLLNQK